MIYGDGATGARGRVVAVEDSDSTNEAELGHPVVRGLIPEYLDDALDPERRERVRHHVDHCRDCRAFLRTLEQTTAPSGLSSSIVDRYRRTRGCPPR